MPVLDLGGTFYKSESLPISAQECVNFYLNIPERASTSTKTLFSTPGIRQVTTAGGDVYSRGGHVFNDIPYVVQGTNLFRINVTVDSFGNNVYSSTQVNGSTPLPGFDRVMMSDNGTDGNQLVIILPESDIKFNAYIYTVAGGLVQISDTDFDGPVSTVRFVDGYFLFTKKNGQKFFVSDLRDGFSYNALDFADAEADPDAIVGSFILRNSPYIFGSETVQQFQNVGGSGFPFAAVPGSVHRKGLVAPQAIEEVNDLMVFLGRAMNETPSIWISNGGSIEKLSTIAIDSQISRYSESVNKSCFAWKYSQAGAQFVGFTFPGEETFVFDFTAKEWHTRESSPSNSPMNDYRVCAVMDAYGDLIVSDRFSNKIGVLDRDFHSEYDTILKRRFITPQLDNDGAPFFVDSLELVAETGVGGDDGSLVSMSFSSDGGRTFSNPLERNVGKTGQYRQRIIWNSLGRFGRDACFRFDMSDPVKWAVLKVEAQLE